jgi:DNA-binding Lrp family transcriptional regulator
MRLSDKERLVLAAAELRADAPMAELRKETGLREHTIRYALRRLIQRKVASPIPLVNLQVLGMTIFNIFFSVGAEKRATKDALLKAFSQSKEVVWIGEFGGEYQYGLAVVGKHVGTALDLLNTLAQKYQNIFFEKSVAWQSSVTVYYRKYLTSKRMAVKPLTCRYTDQTVEIDEIDEKVLSGLTSLGGESHRQIAMALKMPLSTFELRVRKLTEKGVLAGHILAVDPTTFGMQGYKLLVYGKGLNASLAKGLSKFCEQHRSITYLIECIGSWDYEIGVEAEHPQEVTEVVQEIYEQFGALVNNVKLLNKFSDVKIRWYF